MRPRTLWEEEGVAPTKAADVELDAPGEGLEKELQGGSQALAPLTTHGFRPVADKDDFRAEWRTARDTELRDDRGQQSALIGKSRVCFKNGNRARDVVGRNL